MARKRKSNLRKIMNTIRKGFQQGNIVGGKDPYYVFLITPFAAAARDITS